MASCKINRNAVSQIFDLTEIGNRWHPAALHRHVSNILKLFFMVLLCWQPALASVNQIPDNLKPWQPWVLEKHPSLPCPFLYSHHDQPTCSWPSKITLRVDDQGVDFELIARVFAPGWVTLPGNHQHWPLLNNAKQNPSTGLHKNQPAAYLQPGQHRLIGRISWQQRPDFIPLPVDTGLIELWVDGQQIAYPRFEPSTRLRKRVYGSRLWLAKKQSDPIDQPAADQVIVRVFRKIDDGIPLRVTTRVELDVAGRSREQLFSRLLLDGFKPLSIDSPIPAVVDLDGQLRVQLQPGNWVIEVTSQRTQTLTELTMPPRQGLWPSQELWVFKPDLSQRTLQIEGVATIDPQQTRLPDAWRKLNAYRISPTDTMRFIEKSRGDPQPARNQLALKRQMWLDFNGSHYTLKDSISGTMNRDWRLEINPLYELGQVTVNGDPQLITSRGESQLSGVEIRQRQVDLSAVSRLPAETSVIATGWLSDFDQLDITLHLPPGWRLFAVSGTDRTTSTWLGSWDLWDIFLLLIISLAALRLRGIAIGGLALATLALTHGEAGSPLFGWLNLLAVMALLPLLPAGRAKKFFDRYRWLSVLALVIIILPFSVNQVRQGIYPQLERPWQQVHPLNQKLRKTAQPASQAPSNLTIYRDVERDLGFDSLDSGAGSAEIGQPVIISADGQVLRSGGGNISALDPDIATQTGPGIPEWRWNQFRLSWNGPVTDEQSMQIYLLPPWLNSLLAFIRVLLLSLFLASLPGFGYRPSQGFTRPGTGKNAMTSGLTLLLGLGLLILPTQQAHADWPSQELLNQLEQRLTKAPDCLPDCAIINRSKLVASPGSLRVQLWIDSHDLVLIPLPAADKKAWWVDRISVNGKPASAIQRSNGQLKIALSPGQHKVELSGPLTSTTDLQLNFPMQPHNFELQLEGWKAAGLVDGQLRGRSLGLQKIEQLPSSKSPVSATNQPTALAPTAISTLVRVERQIKLGLDWHITTTVIRIAPLRGAINIEVPLLAGESPTAAGLPVEDGQVAVTLGPRQSRFSWRSNLNKTDTLLLEAGEEPDRLESWTVSAGPVWRVESLPINNLAPLPPIKQQITSSSGQWRPQWRPWPGEQLRLRFTRPKGISGQVFTIDEVKLKQTPGKRQSKTEMSLKLRASTGFEHPLQLPPGARLEMVTLDGKQLPISEQQDKLLLALSPGSHRVDMRWSQQQQRQWKIETPSLDLGVPSSNIDLTLKLPHDRWLLFLGGPKIGPALLYWGVLLIILLVGFGLGRFSNRKGATPGQPPLKARHWMLIGLGMSTGTFPAILLVVGWFFLLGWRSQLMAKNYTVTQFNLIQAGLALLTIASLSALLGTIPFGLLAQPDMGVVGNGSSRYLLHWYQDISSSHLPSAWVISLPMWVYRLAMLIWSLWLANALIGWAKWGWQAYSHQGLWQKSSPISPDGKTTIESEAVEAD